MADNVNLTAGDGTIVGGADVIAGVAYPRVKVVWGPDNTVNDTDIATGKPLPVQLRTATGTATPLPALGTAGTAATDVITVQGIASGTAQAVSVASGGIASGALASGSVASGAIASGAVASGAFASGALASGSIAAGAIAAGATSIADNEDVASADGDRGVKVLAVRKATPANTSGTDGDYEFLQISGGKLWTTSTIDSTQLATLQTSQPAMSSPGSTSVILPSDMPWPKGLSNRVFGVAFATLTRPANTTAYTAADSISDNATAGSVTALVSGNISDTNDDPIFISSIHVTSTDTGLAGKKLRAYIFNTDPTASSGVGGGDNAAYSQKMAGYLGSFMGWMETGFSDGSVGRLVPCYNETNFTQAGGFIVVPPKSGAKTLYIQYQAVEGFTPSANSTTIIGTARGWQGRAA
jgi:hypothetical protein